MNRFSYEDLEHSVFFRHFHLEEKKTQNHALNRRTRHQYLRILENRDG